MIDRLVAGVNDGDAAAKTRSAQVLRAAYAEQRWGKFQVLAAGLFLRPSALAVDRAREIAISALSCANALQDDRQVALEQGSWINTYEVEAWRELIVSGAVTDDDLYEREFGNIWAVLEVTRSVRSRCCLAIIDDYGDTLEIVAACSSRSEAMLALRARGYVSVADYAARTLERWAGR